MAAIALNGCGSNRAGGGFLAREGQRFGGYHSGQITVGFPVILTTRRKFEFNHPLQKGLSLWPPLAVPHQETRNARQRPAGRPPWAFSPFWAETSKIATMQRRLITQASAHGWLHQRHRLVFPQIPIKRVLKHFAFWWDLWRVKTKNGPKGPYSLVFWRRR